MPTAARIKKVTEVLSRRQPDLRVVLEGVTITHNASAVIRTCDAAGVLYVDIISASDEPLIINKAISTRAEKWVEIHRHSSPASCLLPLKKKGYRIAATYLGEKAIPYTELDYARPLAIVFGSESEGVSEETLALADDRVMIPMVGMVQSLNLSVSVGIILYEAIKQRKAKGYSDKIKLTKKEFKKFQEKWLPSPSGKAALKAR